MTLTIQSSGRPRWRPGNRRQGTWAILGAIVAGLMIFGIVGGCQFKGGKPKERAATDGKVWHPHPVKVRIYPSTRFATRAKGPLLEVKVELLDAMGDTMKSPGVFRIELYAAGDAGHGVDRGGQTNAGDSMNGGRSSSRAGRAGGATGRRLYSWRVEVRTLAQQREFFDSVTRTYSLRLQLANLALDQPRVKLQVTFIPVRGPLLQTRKTLKPRRTQG